MGQYRSPDQKLRFSEKEKHGKREDTADNPRVGFPVRSVVSPSNRPLRPPGIENRASSSTRRQDHRGASSHRPVPAFVLDKDIAFDGVLATAHVFLDDQSLTRQLHARLDKAAETHVELAENRPLSPIVDHP